MTPNCAERRLGRQGHAAAALTMLVVTWLTAVPSLAPAQDTGRPGSSDQHTLAPMSARGRQAIGPGKVRFAQTRAGRWLEFVESWDSAENLISGGGFAVFAADPDGEIVEVANTQRTRLLAREVSRNLPTCHDGIEHGFRAPSPGPDDDGDGRVDEDRLDGVDNDNDGRVDEDFAAIGDEMIVSCYLTPEGEAGRRLAFHQEVYAWSLPHIDRAIMLSLSVRNIGSAPMSNVRVAAYFSKRGPMRITGRMADVPVGLSGAVRASAFLAQGSPAPGVALMGLPWMQNREAIWTGGYGSTDGWARSVMHWIQARDFAGGAASDTQREDPPPPATGFRILEPGAGHDLPGEAVVCTISPNLGSLAPGEETRVDLALVAARDATTLGEASANVLKTYMGDGEHHYIPPPVSMTPRVLWGTYRPDGGDDRVVVEIEERPRNAGRRDRISFLFGVDPSAVEERETSAGSIELILRGEIAQNLVKKPERVTLKGRLASGAFFEAILRPDDALSEDHSAFTPEPETYWKTPGKLAPELLKGSPNPFRNATTIIYEVPSRIQQDDGTEFPSTGPYETSIKIYNVAGRLVSILVEQQAMPGVFTTEWAAVDDHGHPVASGVYYVKLQVEQKSVTKRLILLK